MGYTYHSLRITIVNHTRVCPFTPNFCLLVLTFVPQPFVLELSYVISYCVIILFFCYFHIGLKMAICYFYNYYNFQIQKKEVFSNKSILIWGGANKLPTYWGRAVPLFGLGQPLLFQVGWKEKIFIGGLGLLSQIAYLINGKRKSLT